MSESDKSLITEFNARRSEAAFAALVRHHINMVFSTALRQVGDAFAAEEITQNVFVTLAQSSGKLGSHPTIAGWLYQTTLNKAREWLRAELRRRRREQMAADLNLARAEGDSVWSPLVPLLDEALLELPETDRSAVVMHFMEGQTYQEVGSALDISEDAARKRVNRCLEQLTHFFQRRGFATPALTASAPLFTLSLHVAPAGLAAQAVSAGLAAVHSATSTLPLLKGVLKLMAWSKTQIAVTAGVIILCAMGATKITSMKIAEHQPQPWQKAYNPSLLDTLPPQVRVLPSPPFTMRSSALHVWGSQNGKILGLGQSVADLLLVAYQVHAFRLIWHTPVPPGKYDFIANLNNPMDNILAAQELFQKKFGLSIQTELINTNAFILTVQTHSAPGLHLSPGITFSDNEEADSFSSHGRSAWVFIDYVEHNLGTMLMDETGLTDNYDIDFKWDKTPEGLKRALRDQLGLELTLTNMPIQMLVVEKAK